MDTITFEPVDEHADSYLAEFRERAEGDRQRTPLDIANNAVERAEQSASVLTGDTRASSAEFRADIAKRLAHVRNIAVLVGRMSRRGMDDHARVTAAVGMQHAIDIDNIDHMRIDGLVRPSTFENRGRSF